jgi:superfamily I DNA/RNA helicase
MLTSFSRVAASELYGKASESFSREYADQMSIGTIHSICYKIVMENLKLLGFSTLIVRGDSYLTAIALNRHPGVIESKNNGLRDYAKKQKKKFLFWEWEISEDRASIIVRLVKEYLSK